MQGVLLRARAGSLPASLRRDQSRESSGEEGEGEDHLGRAVEKWLVVESLSDGAGSVWADGLWAVRVSGCAAG